MDQNSISMNDAADLFRRRWPMATSVASVVFLGAVVTAFTLENVYRSVGEVTVTEPEYPVGPGGKPILPLDQRIYELTDEVLVRANLIEAVERFDLFPGDRIDDSPGSVTGLVRENLEVTLKRKVTDAADRDLGKVVGFTVTFYYDDPRTARDVAKFFVGKFVEAKDARRDSLYGAAIADLEIVVAGFEERLGAKEEELAGFEETYPDAMPDRMRWNMQQIETKSSRLTQTGADIRSLETRVADLMNQLSETPAHMVDDDIEIRIRDLREKYHELLGIWEPDHPEVRRVRRQLEALDGAGSHLFERQMLELALRGELERLAASHYGPDHPERLAAERRVQALRQELERLPAESEEPTEPTNPDYVSLQLQLNAARTELRARQEVRKTLEAEIADLEASLDIAPRVKQELQGILREIDLLTEEVKSAKKELEKAKTRIGTDPWETWTVTNPQMISVPAFPNRSLYVVLGAFIGLTLGIGAGLITEAVDSTVRGTRDLRSVMQMPPISAIPVIKTAGDKRRDRVRLAAVTGMVLVAVGAVGAYVHFQINGVI
jgi:uncharacterized protein involved in exopolysaccharide biosynthesis